MVDRASIFSSSCTYCTAWTWSLRGKILRNNGTSEAEGVRFDSTVAGVVGEVEYAALKVLGILISEVPMAGGGAGQLRGSNVASIA